MKEMIFIFAMVTILGAATLTTVAPYLELASADPDRKFKAWETEFGWSFVTGKNPENTHSKISWAHVLESLVGNSGT